VGGQRLTIKGLAGTYDDIFLPLSGEHQARNAATALAAVEAFFGAGGDRQLDVDKVREGFATVASPGRLERVRATPSVFIDASHNPHGAAALAKADRTYADIFLPLSGEHQARNAATALAAVEAFFGAGGDRQLDVDKVREGFATVASPGRLERVRATPSVFIDASHNPHGAAALAKAVDRDFDFRRLIGVVAVLGDKDARGILAALEPVLDDVVITEVQSPRA